MVKIPKEVTRACNCHVQIPPFFVFYEPIERSCPKSALKLNVLTIIKDFYHFFRFFFMSFFSSLSTMWRKSIAILQQVIDYII